MATCDSAGHSTGLPKNTNDPLPEPQKREIRQMILVEQEDIRVIDREISQVQSVMPAGNLWSRRSKKKDLVAFLKILISPMKELPNEIIGWVFEQYAHGPLPIRNNNHPSPPWYLAQICSRWRAVALSIPALWNFFVVDIDQVRKGDSRSFDIAKHLLLRTGQSDFSCIANSESLDIMCLFKLFSSHANRLRYLKLDGVDGMSSLAGVPEAPFTSLELLDIVCYSLDDTSVDGHQKSITVFNDTPRLRRVSIFTELDPESPDPLSLCLPWHQLTHLHISNSGFPAFHLTHVLLLQCPNLTECSLNMPENVHEPIMLPIINLRCLQSLSLTSKGPRMYGQFLQYLAAPCLKRLSFASEDINSSWYSEDAIDLIQRSACEIEALKISLNFSNVFVIDMLQVTPSLQRLSVGSSDILSSIIKGMIWDGILPELRLFEYITKNLQKTMKILDGIAQHQGFNEVALKRDKSIGIDLAVTHPFEKGACALASHALSVKLLEVALRQGEDIGFMEYPDGEIFPESLVNRQPYYVEVQPW